MKPCPSIFVGFVFYFCFYWCSLFNVYDIFSIGEVKLQVARPVVEETSGSGSGSLDVTPPPEEIMAYSIEECQCPEGYAGLSCEVSCSEVITGVARNFDWVEPKRKNFVTLFGDVTKITSQLCFLV